jgi:hypothetical protein
VYFGARAALAAEPDNQRAGGARIRPSSLRIWNRRVLTGNGPVIAGSNVQFFVNNAPWADVHYTLNNGLQPNIRMTVSGGNNTYTPNVATGTSVRYRFTIDLDAGRQTETAWVRFTK